MTERYFGGFDSVEDVIRNFSEYAYGSGRKPLEDAPKDEEIIFASYGGGMYEGDATVLLERDGKLFEVRGGHCSCDGLEGQWSPSEVTWEALALRLPEMKKGKGYHFLCDHETDAQKAFIALVESRLN